MIRPYTKSDYPILKGWCEANGISTLTEATIPYSTFIAEYEGQPVMSLSLILPNSKEIAYLEYFIASPAFKSEKRSLISKDLVKYAEDVAKSMGYVKLTCLAPNAALASHYESFGYRPNLSGLTLLVKELR